MHRSSVSIIATSGSQDPAMDELIQLGSLAERDPVCGNHLDFPELADSVRVKVVLVCTEEEGDLLSYRLGD